PALRHPVSDALMKRSAIHRQVLDRPRARVAGAREDIDHPLLEDEEWLDGVLAQVRRERDRVRLEMTEQRGGVALRGWTDVPSLGVQDDEQVGWKVSPHALERSNAGRPECLEEGDVDLHRRGVLA